MRAFVLSSLVAVAAISSSLIPSVARAQEPQPAPAAPPAAPETQAQPAPEALPTLPTPAPPLPPPAEETSEPAPAEEPIEVAPPPVVTTEDVGPTNKKGDPSKSPFFVGISVGYGWANAIHPDLATSDFQGVVLNAHAGYTLSEHFTIGLDASNFETGIERAQKGQPFTTHDKLYPSAAGSGDSGIEAKGSSGFVTKTTLSLFTIGPRLEYTPFGRDGLYIGGTAGPAVMGGLDGSTGFGATARAGLRGRLATILTFSVEGGITGQTFSNASSSMPFISASFRPYF